MHPRTRRWLAAMVPVLGALVPAPACLAQRSVCPGATTGGAGDVIAVPILIDNPEGIDAFGLDFVFAAGVLRYEGTTPSALTAGWITLDGTENQPGTVTMGGFDTTPISTSAPDTLGYISLTILVASQVSYTVTNFVDDLAGTPDCAETLTGVEAISWGRIKAVHGPESPPRPEPPGRGSNRGDH